MGRSIAEGGRAGRASDGGWVTDIGDEEGDEGAVIFFDGPQESSARVSRTANTRVTGA